MDYIDYKKAAKALRHDPIVEAWIKTYAQDRRQTYDDCRHCSYPHEPAAFCNTATFGEMKFCGTTYYVSLSDVVSKHSFMKTHVPPGAFHWRNGRFFRRVPDGVELTYFTEYNNTPQRKVWLIPAAEWDTIVNQMAIKPHG